MIGPAILRSLSIVWLLLVSTACAAAARPAATPSPSSRPIVVSSAQAATPYPLPVPGAAPVAVFFGHTLASTTTHIISLVGLDGHVLASANGADRTLIAQAGCGGIDASAARCSSKPPATELPYVSVSNSRAYFLDGDNRVRSLSADGTVVDVTTVPGSATLHSTFAVSPDDSRIAVSVLDYSVSPVRVSLFVEDIHGGNRNQLFTSNSSYAWPVGWHAGNLVLAAGTPFPDVTVQYYLNCGYYGGCTLPTPAGATLGIHVSSAIDGSRIATIGADCDLVGVLNSAGVLCRHGRPGGYNSATQQTVAPIPCATGYSFCLDLVDWNGVATRWTRGNLTTGVLTPSGKLMAGCCNPNNLIVLIPRPADGGTETVSPAWGRPDAWVDETHLVYNANSEVRSYTAILDTVSGASVTVEALGSLIATLPGAL